jgi:hypothetical protein
LTGKFNYIRTQLNRLLPICNFDAIRSSSPCHCDRRYCDDRWCVDRRASPGRLRRLHHHSQCLPGQSDRNGGPCRFQANEFAQTLPRAALFGSPTSCIPPHGATGDGDCTCKRSGSWFNVGFRFEFAPRKANSTIDRLQSDSPSVTSVSPSANRPLIVWISARVTYPSFRGAQ